MNAPVTPAHEQLAALCVASDAESEHIAQLIANAEAAALVESRNRNLLLADAINRMSERNATLRAQLPEEMQACTIRFKSCEKGHGWLTATNWIQHGCPTCERNALRAALDDIHLTAHCLAKAGPLTTPTLSDAWNHFDRIAVKATNALHQTRLP